MTLTPHYRVGLILVTAAPVARSTSGLFTRQLTADTFTLVFWRGLFGAIGTALLIVAIPGQRSFGGHCRPGPANLYKMLSANTQTIDFIQLEALSTRGHPLTPGQTAIP